MGVNTDKQVEMRGIICFAFQKGFSIRIFAQMHSLQNIKLCMVRETFVAVVDIFRRDGDKLAENWMFTDLLYFWKQQGLDILERMEKDNTYRSPS